jgi:hypothetical protein
LDGLVQRSDIHTLWLRHSAHHGMGRARPVVLLLHPQGHQGPECQKHQAASQQHAPVCRLVHGNIAFKVVDKHRVLLIRPRSLLTAVFRRAVCKAACWHTQIYGATGANCIRLARRMHSVASNGQDINTHLPLVKQLFGHEIWGIQGGDAVRIAHLVTDLHL